MKKKHKRGYKQGKFTPTNPHTYVGDVSKITYRSSWELKFFLFLDNLSGIDNSPIIAWNSEEVIVKYVCSTDGKEHRYYPDVYMETRNSSNEVIKYLIEIKPYSETLPPKKGGKWYNQQMLTYIKNRSKWEEAERFCKKNNLVFKIITEYELGLKKR